MINPDIITREDLNRFMEEMNNLTKDGEARCVLEIYSDLFKSVIDIECESADYLTVNNPYGNPWVTLKEMSLRRNGQTTQFYFTNCKYDEFDESYVFTTNGRANYSVTITIL